LINQVLLSREVVFDESTPPKGQVIATESERFEGFDQWIGLDESQEESEPENNSQENESEESSHRPAEPGREFERELALPTHENNDDSEEARRDEQVLGGASAEESDSSAEEGTREECDSETDISA